MSVKKNFKQKRYKYLIGYMKIAAFANALLSLVIFFLIRPVAEILLSTPEHKFTIDDKHVLVLSVGLTLIGIYLTHRSYHLEILDEIAKKDSRLRISRIQTRMEATKVIQSRVSKATRVRNTYFPNANLRPANKDSYGGIREIYENWLTSREGREWIDIVTPEEIFEGRYKNLGQDLTIKTEKTLNLHVLRHKNTCPNFLVFDYEDGGQEVFWGWVSEKHNSLSNQEVAYVYHSSEPELITYYEELFDVLQNRKTWDDPIVTRFAAGRGNILKISNHLVDKIGCWATISGKKKCVNTYGFYHIDIESNHADRRGFAVVGYTFDSNFRVIEVVDHKQSQVAHYENKMLIEYGPENSSGRRGICFYEFFRVQRNHFLQGFFKDENSLSAVELAGTKTDFQKIDDLDLKVGEFAPDSLKAILEENEMQLTQYLRS